MSIINLALPKYVTELPVSKMKIEYRGFTVKEEKILLLAQEENKLESTIQAISQIISNCTFSKASVDTLNSVDAEYLYVQIRNKSMGEGVPIKGICTSCGEKTPLMLEYDKVEVIGLSTSDPTYKILDNVWLTLKYPTLRESLLTLEADSTTAIAYSLDKIIDGDAVKKASDYTLEEKVEFVESMTNAQVELLNPFFENFPTLVLNKDFKCNKCGVDNHIHIEGIENFFA